MAHWVWGLTFDDNFNLVASGFLGKLPALDFAGGSVIHISSGFSGLAAALILGERKDKDDNIHSSFMTLTGTGLLWFGWFGFNAGSAGGANGIAAIAFLNTHLTPCISMISFVILELIHEKKTTIVGACNGVLAGLVCITPACGFVEPMSCFAFGIGAAIISYYGAKLKYIFNIDDSLDCFAVHGLSGLLGSLLTGLFATQKINPA